MLYISVWNPYVHLAITIGSIALTVTWQSLRRQSQTIDRMCLMTENVVQQSMQNSKLLLLLMRERTTCRRHHHHNEAVPMEMTEDETNENVPVTYTYDPFNDPFGDPFVEGTVVEEDEKEEEEEEKEEEPDDGNTSSTPTPLASPMSSGSSSYSTDFSIGSSEVFVPEEGEDDNSW